MKKLLRYFWRDKVDLIMFCLVLFAVVQYFIWGKNVTPGFAILALYCFGVIHRLGTFTDIIKDQQKKIDELNEQLDLKDSYIRKIITKYRVNQNDQP